MLNVNISPCEQVNHTSTWGGFDVKNDALHLRVYPEVDYAFIVALSVILHEITYSSNDTSSAHHAHHAHHHGAHHHDAHVHHLTHVHATHSTTHCHM